MLLKDQTPPHLHEPTWWGRGWEGLLGTTATGLRAQIIRSQRSKAAMHPRVFAMPEASYQAGRQLFVDLTSHAEHRRNTSYGKDAKSVCREQRTEVPKGVREGPRAEPQRKTHQ